MYEIKINGEVVLTTQYPNWVRWNKKLGYWRLCDEEHAEAILITLYDGENSESYYCNISGKPVVNPDLPTADITKV